MRWPRSFVATLRKAIWSLRCGFGPGSHPIGQRTPAGDPGPCGSVVWGFGVGLVGMETQG